MKPPSAEACKQALNILLSSIRTENDISDSPNDVDGEDLSFEVCDFVQQAIPLATDTLCNQARLRAASCCKRRNALLPIGQLPYELLENLFNKCIDPSESHRARALGGLARVASSWWAVVKSSAPLWATIDTDDPKYPLALRKAKKTPLYIHIRKFGLNQASTNDFLALVEPERDYWRSLSVYDISAPDLLYQLLEPAMPQLDYLKIEIPSPDNAPSGEIPLIPSTTFPLLTHLVIKQIGRCILWKTPPVLPFLKYLMIDHSSLQSIEHLLFATFASSPLLETLDMMEASSDGSDYPTTTSSRLLHNTISLPHLRTLLLMCFPGEWAVAFINHLHAPILSSLHIRVATYAPILQTLKRLEDNSSLVERVMRLALVDVVEVWVIDNSSFRARGYRGKAMDFLFRLDGNAIENVFRDLLEYPPFDYPGVPPINLVLFGPCLEHASQVTFLPAMPSLRRITFKNSTSIPLLEYLSNPLPDGGDGERWPCPMLCEIVTVASWSEGMLSEEKRCEISNALGRLISVRRAAAVKGDGSPVEILLTRTG